jgi:hypothetical protein
MKTRDAKVGDKLATTHFPVSWARGFAAVDEKGKVDVDCAVCLKVGTEIAFDEPIRGDDGWSQEEGYQASPQGHKVARFTKLNLDRVDIHHDAIEFPDGTSILISSLKSGQRATVLQLPAEKQPEKAEPLQEAPRETETV